MSDESIDLQIDDIYIGFDEDPVTPPQRTVTDPVEELVAVMETLADWLDEIAYSEEDDDFYYPNVWLGHEIPAALAQILELTQVLFAEHQQAIAQINEFVGAMQIAKDEATKGTKLIVANAGDMKRFIRE